MNPDYQTIGVIVIVTGTVFLLVRGAIRKQKKPGCGGDCGCPTAELKSRIKR